MNPKVFSFIAMVFIIVSSCISVLYTDLKLLWLTLGLIGGASMGVSGLIRKDQWLVVLETFFVFLNGYGILHCMGVL